MTRRRIVPIVAVVLLAVALRGLAVELLPMDFDEPVYFRAGQRLAEAVRGGDLERFVNADSAPEHPGLVKLVYAAVFLRFPPAPELSANIDTYFADADAALIKQIGRMGDWARRASALFGALNVLLVALVSPLAGALLAVHTYTVKYTAQVYLEALPMFTATVAVLAYMRALRPDSGGSRTPPVGERDPQVWPGGGWWWLSAVALGLTAAGKYVYAVAGLAIVADWVWRVAAARRPRRLLSLAAWGGLALLVFYAANPTLWPDPFGRLWASLSFHLAYSHGEQVARLDYPWWQPFVWLFASMPVRWHPGIIVTGLDGLTAALGVLGAPLLWRRQRVIVLWWAVGLAFLLAWNTKWPQYSLIMTVPMCLCAAEALRWLWARVPAELKMAAGERHGW